MSAGNDWRTVSAHPYGPHDPATAPRTTTVLGEVPGRRFPVELEAPRPEALVDQRERLNNRAHIAAGIVNLACLVGIVLIPTLLLVIGTAQ